MIKKSYKKIFIYVFLCVIVLLISIEIFLRFYWPGLTDGWKFMKYDSDLIRKPKGNLKNVMVSGVSREFRFKINTDNNGFRYVPSFNNNKKTKRLFIIGDSMTFGYGVDDEYAFPSIMNKYLKDYKVINGGFHGYTLDCYYIFLKNYLEKLNADLFIVSVFLGNDIKDLNLHNISESDGKIKIELPSDKIPIIIKKTAVFQLIRLIVKGYLRQDLNVKVEPVKGKKIKVNSFQNKQKKSFDENSVFDIYYFVEKLSNLFKKKKKKIIFLFIPDKISLKNNKFDSVKNKLKMIMNRRKISYIDLESFLKKSMPSSNRIYYKYDGHFTEYGNSIVGKEIASQINSLN